MVQPFSAASFSSSFFCYSLCVIYFRMEGREISGYTTIFINVNRIVCFAKKENASLKESIQQPFADEDSV